MKKLLLLFLMVFFFVSACDNNSQKTSTISSTTISSSTTSKKTTISNTTSKNNTSTTEKKTTTKPNIPITTDQVDKNLYVSNVTEPSEGTLDNPTTLIDSLNRAKDDQIVYILAGTYSFSEGILLNKTNANKQIIEAYNGEVIFDFNNSQDDYGILISGTNYLVKGITVTGVGVGLDVSWSNATTYLYGGIIVCGNDNIVEQCISHHNIGSGISITRYDTSNSTYSKWPMNNLILNSTSYKNGDNSHYASNGFEVKAVNEGNALNGCIAYGNLNNGFEVTNSESLLTIGVVELRNCIAYKNGIDINDKYFSKSPGNGFLVGGKGNATNHKMINCLSAFNRGHGFNDGSNNGNILFESCTSYMNSGYSSGDKSNFNSQSRGLHTYLNCLSYSGGLTMSDKYYGSASYSYMFNSSKYYYISTSIDVNSSTSSMRGTEVATYNANEIFISTEIDLSLAYRNEDGTIRTNGFLEVKDDFAYYGNGKKLGAIF